MVRLRGRLVGILATSTLLLAACAKDASMPLATFRTEPSTATRSSGSATSEASLSPTALASTSPSYEMARIPGGAFEMGDHSGYADPQHPSDELPIHSVKITAFAIGVNDVTVDQYVDYLNSAMSAGLLRVGGGSYGVSGGPTTSVIVAAGVVYLAGGSDILYLTRQAYRYSPIGWDGRTFSALDNRGRMPVTSVSWFGAAAYANWLSLEDGYRPCYDTATWSCDISSGGYRLPSEAEWEYAARGGQNSPYYNYPWGNDADTTKANWPNSGDPYETGPAPHTTPVGFYDGELHRKSDFGWPGSQETYQTANGANGYGLYDMAGNVWQWCNDWYRTDYYKVSPSLDPAGPQLSEASPMPDGKFYRVLRGGNWYNGEPDKLLPAVDNGHSRVSNRDPAYYLGQEEFQQSEVGFRLVRRGS